MNRQEWIRQLEPWLAHARNWYREREPREQLVLKLLAGMLAVAFFWFLVWQPLTNARDQARSGWISAEQTRQWIEANRGAVQQARQQQGQPAGGDWIGQLNARAAQYQVTLKGYTPEGENSVRVLLEDQALSNVLLWLQGLRQEAGVVAGSIEISEGSRDGTVNVRATLERGA